MKVKKSRPIIGLLIILWTVVSCASLEGDFDLKPAPYPDSDYVVTGSNKFSVAPPPAGWQPMYSSKDLRMFTPRVVKLYYLKPDNGSRIVVMLGFKNEYELSDNIELDTTELVYFTHILGRGHGNFRGVFKYNLKNPLFRNADFFSFEGAGSVLSRGRNMSVVLEKGRITCIDFYADFDNFNNDLPVFLNFLENFRLL